jgi:phosphopantetheinyl transferase
MGQVLSRDHELDAERFDVQPWPRDDRRELRWVVDISQWRPRLAEWHLLLETLPLPERKAMVALPAQFDQKRALISRLIQRRAIGHALGVAESEIEIARTLGGKPYATGVAASPERRPGAPNFNFNVAHDGGVIVLVTDPVLLIGVDVTAPFHLRSARFLAPAETSAPWPPGPNGRTVEGSGSSRSHGGESGCGEGHDDYRRLQIAFAHVMTPDEWDAIDAAEAEQSPPRLTERHAQQPQTPERHPVPELEDIDAAEPEPSQPTLAEALHAAPLPLPEHHPVPEPSPPDVCIVPDEPARSGAEQRRAPCARASDIAPLAAFRSQWSRKEAFAKARGDGLAFELRRAEFCSTRPPQPPRPPDCANATNEGGDEVQVSPQPPRPPDRANTASEAGDEVHGAPALSSAPSEGHGMVHDVQNMSPARLSEEAGPSFSRLYLDDVLRNDWACWTHMLCGGYAVSVARGPVAEAQDVAGGFIATFGRSTVPEDEMRARLATPPAPFRLLQIADLVPETLRAGYAAAADAAGAAWTGQVAESGEPAGTPAGVESDGRSEGAGVPHAAHLDVPEQPPPWVNPANIRQPAKEPGWDDACSIS